MEKALTPFPFKFAFYRGPGERAKSAGKPAGINKGSRGLVVKWSEKIKKIKISQNHSQYFFLQYYILLDKHGVIIENCNIKLFRGLNNRIFSV